MAKKANIFEVVDWVNNRKTAIIPQSAQYLGMLLVDLETKETLKIDVNIAKQIMERTGKKSEQGMLQTFFCGNMR